MIVVPAFAESNEGEEEVVFAGVRGWETALTENVRERIDGKRAVPEQYGTQEETPGKQRKAADEIQDDAENGGWNEVVFVQPSEFGEFGEVADVVEARFVVTVGKNPADVRPPKAEQGGRMEVVFLVRIAMMMPVMSGPPEHSFLRGRHRHPGDDELKPAAGLEGAMREVTMVARGDKEHANFVSQQAGEGVIPFEREEEDAQGDEMNQGKRDGRDNVKTRPVGQGDSEGTCNGSHSELLQRKIKPGGCARVGKLRATDHIYKCTSRTSTRQEICREAVP